MRDVEIKLVYINDQFIDCEGGTLSVENNEDSWSFELRRPVLTLEEEGLHHTDEYYLKLYTADDVMFTGRSFTSENVERKKELLVFQGAGELKEA